MKTKLIILILSSLILANCGDRTAGQANIPGFKKKKSPESTESANLVLSDNFLGDFGDVVLQTSTAKKIMIVNKGSAPAENITVSDLPSQFVLSEDEDFSCDGDLGAGESCVLTIKFAPNQIGSTKGSVKVEYSYNNKVVSSVHNLVGKGVLPANLTFSLSGGSYDFGTKGIKTTSVAQLTVKNVGQYPAKQLDFASVESPFSLAGQWPGVSGTCKDTLLPEESCSIGVNYAPTIAQSNSGILKLRYSSGKATEYVSATLLGRAIGLAELAFMEFPLYDFGQVVIGVPSLTILHLSNMGDSSATNISLTGFESPFSYDGGSFPGVGGTCSQSLAPHASCTIVVKYLPLTAGLKSIDLLLKYIDGDGLKSTNLRIQGQTSNAANLTLSESPLFSFNSLVVGQSQTKIFTLTNIGANSTALDVAALGDGFVFDGGFPGVGGNCSSTIAGNSSCQIAVKFQPSLSKNYSGQLKLSYSGAIPNSFVLVQLSGQAVSVGSLNIQYSPTFDFGSKIKGSSTYVSVSLTNVGQSEVLDVSGSIESPFSFKGGSFPGISGTCSSTIASGQSCSLVVEYHPTLTGLSQKPLVVSYKDKVGTNKNVSLSLQGNAIESSLLEKTGSASVDFGTVAVGSTTSQVITLKNVGGSVAKNITISGLASPVSFRGGSYPGTSGTCSSQLNSGVECSLDLSFSPSVLGHFSSSFSINYDDELGVHKTISIPIVGETKTSAGISVVQGSVIDFGQTLANEVKTKTIEFENSGEFAATGILITGLSVPFAVDSNSCGAILLGGTRCSIVVSYNPSTSGLITNQTLSISYNDGVEVKTISSLLKGQSVTLPTIISITGDSINFGSVGLGSTYSKVITIKNNGGSLASNLSATISNAYSFVGGTYPGIGGTCGAQLAANTTCTFNVEFVPIAVGDATSVLEISFKDFKNQSSTKTINLTGRGLSAGLIEFDASNVYDFNNLIPGASSSKIIKIKNTGETSISDLTFDLDDPFSFTGGSYPGQNGTCGSSLTGGQDCVVEIQFSSMSPGLYNKVVSVSYTDQMSESKNLSHAISGRILELANIVTEEGLELDYGTLIEGQSLSKTLTLKNIGGSQAKNLTIPNLTSPFSKTGGSCASTLDSGNQCDVGFTFSSSVVGDHQTSTTISYLDEANNPKQIQINLKGKIKTKATLSFITGSNYDFGNVVVNKPVSKTITVKNIGQTIAYGIDGLVLHSPYTVNSTTCGTTIAPDQSCVINATFTATTTGIFNESLTLSYNSGAGFSTQSITAQMTGTGLSAPSLIINDGQSVEFNSIKIGTTSTKTITIKNSGGDVAEDIALTLASPFSFTGTSYPGQGGTCSSTLNAGSNCTIEVAFSPTIVGSATMSFDLTYSDKAGIDKNTATTFSGTGLSLAKLEFLDGSSANFGSAIIGKPEKKLLSIRNSGDTDAQIQSQSVQSPFSFEGGSFPGTSGTCSSNVAAHSDCLLSIVFSPLVSESFEKNLSISYSDGIESQSVSIQLLGSGNLEASLSADDTDYDFGSILYTETKNHQFVLTNNGETSATSLGISGMTQNFAFAGGFPGTGGTCGTTLAAKQSCTFVVTFDPKVAGSYSTTYNVQYNSGKENKTLQVKMKGKGLTTASLTFSSSLYDFGVNFTSNSSTLVVSITNEGDVSATEVSGSVLSSPFSYLGGDFPGTGGTCSNSIAAHSSCSIVLEFKSAVSGLFNSTISLSYSNGNVLSSSTSNLLGMAQKRANLTISDSPKYTYPITVVGGSASKVLSITNNGEVSAMEISGSVLSSPYSYRGGTFPGTGGSCGSSLVPGSSCLVVLSYSPTVSGLSTAEFKVSYSNGESSQFVSEILEGISKTPASISVNPPNSYNFGNVLVGQTSSKTLNISNNGETDATIFGGSALVGGYTYTGGVYPGTGGNCGTNLTAGQTCSISITFGPTESGVNAKNLTISYNDGLQAKNLTYSLTGQGLLPAGITISDSPTYTFSDLLNGQTTSRMFTLSNTGNVDATSLSLSALTIPYSYTGGSYPGTGGDCGNGLTAGSSCRISVSFSPIVSGTHSSTIQASYHNGIELKTTSLTIKGTSKNRAAVNFTSTTKDFGTIFVGETSTATFTLHNSGEVKATAIQSASLPAFSYVGGTFPGTGGTCSNELNPDDTCTVVVGQVSTSAGNFTDTLIVQYNDQIESKTTTISLTGRVTTPASLTISNIPYDFGIVYLGSTSSKIFTITNNGGVSATGFSITGLSSPYAFAGGSYPGTGGNCGTSIAASASCSVAISYTPVAIETNNKTFSLVYHNGKTSTFSFQNLTGQGRYKPGSFNTSFGTSGILKQFIGTSTYSYLHEITQQSDGKIVGVGASWVGSQYDFLSVRINANGTMDSSFGTSGYRTVDWGGINNIALSGSLDSSGRMVMAGMEDSGKIPISRLTTSGSLDSTFGSGGKMEIDPVANVDKPFKLKVLSDGKMILAGNCGSSSSPFCAMKLTAAGAFDSTFGSSGKVFTAPGIISDQARASYIYPDNRILVTGSSYRLASLKHELALVRYTSSGALDSTFGVGGVTTVHLWSADHMVRDVTVGSDGKIYALVQMYSGEIVSFVVVKLNSDGSLDTSFNGEGYVYLGEWGTDADSNASIVLQSDGKIIVGGYKPVSSNYIMTLVRVLPTGEYDSTFGTAGEVSLGISTCSDSFFDMIILSDGDLLVAGKFTLTNTGIAFAKIHL